MSELVFIYSLSDPRTNAVRYVGKTHGLKNRLWQHINHAKKKNREGRVYSWIRALLRDGYEPKIEPLEEFPANDIAAWEEAERFWIESLRLYGCELTNLDSGGGNGRVVSAETRAKIGAHSKNRVHSPETRAKIAASCKARMTDAEKEHLSKVGLANHFHHTEEFKQRLSQLKKGQPRPAHVTAALQAGRARWMAERKAAGLPYTASMINAAKQNACQILF